MKVRVCLVLSFLFSVIFISAFPIVSWSCNDFYSIEKLIKEESTFVESGVKIEYESNISLEDTLSLIQKKIKKHYSSSVSEITNDGISIKCNNIEINIIVYENKGKTLVDAVITNFSKDKKLLNLIQDLSQLQVNTSSKPRYFKYIKGKINNTEEGLDIISKVQNIKDINALDIHNGYVGTAKLQDGERVNFAVSNYDKGTYLVIGTPIIFSTY